MMTERLIRRNRSKKGFTLIEIVVVLALAGLILAGVLIAISAAQQSVRDSQRRAAVSQVESALEQWGATHSGSYAGSTPNAMLTIADLYGAADASCPGSSAGPQYLDTGLNAPGGSHYACPNPSYGVPTTTSQVSIADRSGGDTANDGYCVRVKLEGGGGGGEIFGATDTNKTSRNMTSSGCS